MPRHKKKRRAASAAAVSVRKTDWLVGDLVVVKLRGHRPWPAQIQKPEDYGYDARSHRIFVTFFGTEETCFCSYNKITPFTSAIRKGLAEQLQKINTNSELERAIKEIFAADDDLRKSRDNSRHKEEEIGPESAEGPQVERSRKRGRAVADEGSTGTAEERSVKHEKAVKKMANEQAHKLLPKVRIKVSGQPSDSSNSNKQVGGKSVLGSEKASVSSSEALSQQLSPHRTSDLNEKAGEADSRGRKSVRATRIHDAADLADAPDKKRVRAAADPDSEKKDASAKRSVQNGDDADEQMAVEEDTERKEAKAGQEDAENMDVDDEKVEHAKMAGQNRGTGRGSDSIDLGAKGLEKDDEKKGDLRTAERQDSDHANAPLPPQVKEVDSKSAKSMSSGDRDVFGDQTGGKVDPGADDRTVAEASEIVPPGESEVSEVITKVELETSELKNGEEKNLIDSVPTAEDDDSKESQKSETRMEKPPTVAPTAIVEELIHEDAKVTEEKEKKLVKSQATNSTEREGNDAGKPQSTDRAQGATDAVKTHSTTKAEEESADAVKPQSTGSTQEMSGVGGDEGSAKPLNTGEAAAEGPAKVQSTDEDLRKKQATLDSVTTESIAEIGVVKDALDKKKSGNEATTESERVAVSGDSVSIISEQASIAPSDEASLEQEGVQKPSVEGAPGEEKVSGSDKEKAMVASVEGAGSDHDRATAASKADASVGDVKVSVTTVPEAIKAYDK